ncbi:MAG: VIT1/CCC1 transporter family protein [Negativicutes bacterium]|nr:VIT1/CCC1 transporter family protein [Negativicutes bacterium]
MKTAGRHYEKHFTASDTVRDIIIGMSDGLTVPFALAAGISGAVAATGIVVTAGLAEIAAGAISMGFGGYLAARGEAEHYATERLREQQETRDHLEEEEQEIIDIFSSYDISPEESRPAVNALKRNPEIMVDFMMKFELGLEEPDPKRAISSAATIAGSYVVGGFVPLAPYILLPDGLLALKVSVAVTIMTLFLFGYMKGRFLGNKPWFSAFQTMLIGGIAAGVAYFLAKIVS